MQEKNMTRGFRIYTVGALLTLAAWAALRYGLGMNWTQALAVPMAAFAVASIVAAGPLTPIGRQKGPFWLPAVIAWACTFLSLDLTTQSQYVMGLARVAVSAAAVCVTFNWAIICLSYLDCLKKDEQSSQTKAD